MTMPRPEKALPEKAPSAKAPPAVLVIAGSDSSGGAGLARDARALADLGAEMLCAVTAVTAQSDRHVAAVHVVPPSLVRAQIEAALATRTPDAVKIGMLANRFTVEAVGAALKALESLRVPIVLDPVLVSSSGGVLLDEGGRRALAKHLLPITALLTPNVPEAAALLGEPPAASEAALDEQARRLLGLGPAAVLLKGGHACEEEAVDRLVCRGGPLRRIATPRLPATQRGTGCALASAIAAQLAAGAALEDACRWAKAYVGERLRAACAAR